MKKTLFRCMAVALLLAMIVSVCAGCGQGGGNAEPTQAAAATTAAAATEAVVQGEDGDESDEGEEGSEDGAGAQQEATQDATQAAATQAATTQAAAPATPLQERVTLEFLAPAPVSQINDFDEVLNEIYKQTDDILNIRINYTFTTFDDIGQKVSLKMTAGERLDGAFVAQWTNPSMMQMISQGLLTNLDPYFHNDAYPGLKKYFQASYLESNSFKDTNNEQHVYAIPFSNAFSGMTALYYRKDLADKYGVGDIDGYDKIIQYFEAIKANEPGMNPFTFLGSNDGISGTILNLYRDKPWTENHNYETIEGVGVIIGDDGVAYASRSKFTALDPIFQTMRKDPYTDEDPLLAYKLSREWYEKGYFEKDILNQKDHEGQFISGKAASFMRGTDTYNSILNRFSASLAGAELGCFPIDANSRYNTVKAMGTNFQAWNFLAIPVTSKYTDQVMGFVNWIFEDQANHDLMEFGIEGKHWIAIGEDRYDYPEDIDLTMNYNFNGYILTWNPGLVRHAVNTPDFVIKSAQMSGDANSFYKQVNAGFSFVSDSVETEMAKVNDLRAFILAIENGLPENLEAELEAVQKRFDDAGFAKIAEEMERQFNEFLKDNPYQGQ